MAMIRDFQAQARRHGAPITVALILVAVANFFASWVSLGGSWNGWLFFDPANPLPWTAITYPLAYRGPDIIGLLFMSYWLWVIGASVERDLGSTVYAVFLGVMTIVPALMMWIAIMIFGTAAPLAGLYLPVAGITVAWATRNPNQSMLFMMVFPILAKWLGWLTVVLVIFGFGGSNPLVGLFAAAHLLLAYLYAANKMPALAWGRQGFVAPKKQQWLPRERDDKYLNDVKRRETERAERERLRKLFEGSIGDDPEDKR